MTNFFSVANPIIFIILVGLIIIGGLYIIQFRLFVPMRKKHIFEKFELEQKNIKLLSLFATFSPHPLFRFDSEGNILMTNASGQQILNLCKAEERKLQHLINNYNGINLPYLISESKLNL